MGFKYNVRPAGSGDWGTVLKMIEELFQETEEPVCDVKFKEKDLADYGSGDHALLHCILLEAVDDEETQTSEKPLIVGYALYYYAFCSQEGKMVYLENVYVRGGHRENGFGRLLMSTVAKIAANNGCKCMQWMVSTSNEAARGFYDRMKATDKTGKEGWRFNRLEGENFAKLANTV